MDRVFKTRKVFFFQFFISSIFIRFDFIHCEPTGWKWTHSIFELPWRGSVVFEHRLAYAFDKSVHSGSHSWRFLSRGVLHIMAFIGRLRAKGVPFLGFRYKKRRDSTSCSIWKGRNASFRSVERPKRTRLTVGSRSRCLSFLARKHTLHSEILYLHSLVVFTLEPSIYFKIS